MVQCRLQVGNKPYVEDDRHVDGKDELAAELASSSQEVCPFIVQYLTTSSLCR